MLGYLKLEKNLKEINVRGLLFQKKRTGFNYIYIFGCVSVCVTALHEWELILSYHMNPTGQTQVSRLKEPLLSESSYQSKVFFWT